MIAAVGDGLATDQQLLQSVQKMNISDSPYIAQCKEHQRRQEKQSEPSRKGLPKIVVNISETQYAVVRQVAKKLKWTMISDPISSMNFDLCWTDCHVKQETFYKMSQGQKINHFPGMEILSRKNNLGNSLMSFKERFPDQYDFFPNTWMLPYDYQQLKEYHDNRQSGKAQTFIVKPEANCQGRGIYLTRHIEKLKGERCVVQRYLHKPFLIDGLKFDMRIYVLVAGTDPLRLFVYEEGLARFSTEPYVPPRSDNLQNKFMHLTNYAINKLHPNFEFNQSLEDCDKGHKRTLSSTFEAIGRMGHDVDELKARIDDMLIKTMITGYPTISKIQQTVHPENYANDMCFEVLGFDVMLDNKLNPIILEVNYTPSFTTDTPLDKHIKKNLILDCIKLMGVSQQWKHEVRKQREEQIKERMLTGKRKKLNLQDKIAAVQHFARLRDRYQSQNMGNFRKIFVRSQQQFQSYRKFYDYAQELYIANNRLIGTTSNTFSTHYYIPFLKQPQQQETSKKRKDKRERSLYNSNFHEEKKSNARSIDTRKITSAKSTSKRVVISTKNLLEEKKTQTPQQVYFDEANVVFNNNNLKKAFSKKKRQKKQDKNQE